MKRLCALRGKNNSDYVWIGVDPKNPWRDGEGNSVCYAEFLRASRTGLRPGQIVEIRIGNPKSAPKPKLKD